MKPFNTENYKALYGDSEMQYSRFTLLKKSFAEHFDGEPCFFSTAGRTEIIGNHTDHNGGKVLAGSISLDTLAAARKTDTDTVRIISMGYDGVFTVSLNSLEPKSEEKGTTQALIRGVANGLKASGYNIGGFDAFVTSNVLKGSGLSSSASFEVLICTIFNSFYNDGVISPVQEAVISQYAENKYFGKPCGLMDQIACAYGNMVAIDFSCPELAVKEVKFDFAMKGYSLIITDVRQDHADLTCEYAAITNEMAQVSAYFGKKKLCEVSAEDFYNAIPALRASCSDRAILRAMHFFNENKRVDDAVLALENNNLQAFFDAVNSSGESSQCLLQNLFAQGSQEQGVPLALALARTVLKKRGAVRVHGGGFGGTVLGFVPADLKQEYILVMNSVFGEGAAQELGIRKLSTTKID